MKKANILIVEDDPLIAKYMEIVLDHHGYSMVGVVPTGEDAVDLAAKCHPDLVLMDIKLKGKMTGIEAADRIIKETGIFVVYITAYAHQSVRDAAMHTQPIDFIVKPFNGSYLVEVVKKALAGKGHIIMGYRN